HGFGRQNLHVNRNGKSRARREAGNSHAWVRSSQCRQYEALEPEHQALYGHFFRDTFSWFSGGGYRRKCRLRPIIIDTVFSDISETVGTGEVPYNSRMLASSTAYSQGSSPKCCVAVAIFRISPKMKRRRKNQAALFSEKSYPRVRKLSFYVHL
ncbi:unnamed protein product, partial [Sphacelaria rigidula]